MGVGPGKHKPEWQKKKYKTGKWLFKNVAIGAKAPHGQTVAVIWTETLGSRKSQRLAFGETFVLQPKGELVAIFDADFIPPSDFLTRTVPYFTVNDRLAVVQARWGHLNHDYSVLTRIQAILLDGHFVLEHGARNRSGCFFNFNGTSGVWRKVAIADGGGWQHDTLTEDLDLSYRTQLRGWKFLFLPDLVTPAEVPVEMNAFKSQ